MRHTVDYYLAPQSPWTYLGHERFAALARETGAAVRVLPMDLGKIFPISGGLPLPKRAPQRQAYRLLELRRFSEALGVPLHPEPKFFPVAGDPAARLITAVALRDGADAALRITGAVTAAVWAQERDIASMDVLGELLAECGLDAARLDESQQAEVQARYEQQTQAAIDLGVFGAPTYLVDGEMFWGQDRLDFVARRLRA
ncbi:MAG: 2-hydroxychromene-2-carboxylate isomerase [Hydrogenophaga sp.]|jgi:2-hydroxychromene-2-carboxylate isomerase|uniref:2-hydroxychromene-2-carboxylate isomerase n=1 Tax=Hydrogenophaga sp. TaxID=1904254 RepID=UPI0026162735|nr:2-hydroxychromene-2-carboxylate isomerase [Hydrogenophaga sp.]MCV0439494.1 2-hydroxychromene-2-carboxylate isomerase [Hydrogenophaga sp.]